MLGPIGFYFTGRRMKKKKEFRDDICDDSIVLLCVIRDEDLLLPYFITHYKELGVTHFIFIDNGSVDSSLKYLLNIKDVDCQIWSTTDSYAENEFGVGWVNSLLNSQCRDKWCLVVDIDELLVLKDHETLQGLRGSMQESESNVLVTCLIDFYPRVFDVLGYNSGNDFTDHSNYYDIMDNVFVAVQNDNATTIKGGVRHRWMSNETPSNDSVCLTKKSFFKFDFFDTHSLGVGMHWLFPLDFIDWSVYHDWSQSNKALNFYSDIYILQHFKFIKPNVFDYFEERIERNQDWGNSIEYKKYIDNKTDSFYDDTLTRRFSSIYKLYKDTLGRLI